VQPAGRARPFEIGRGAGRGHARLPLRLRVSILELDGGGRRRVSYGDTLPVQEYDRIPDGRQIRYLVRSLPAIRFEVKRYSRCGPGGKGKE
jgi:hypothetical protein